MVTLTRKNTCERGFGPLPLVAHSLTLGCEVHGISLHGVGRAPLVPIAACVAVHVTVVPTWKREQVSSGRDGEEKLAHRESQILTENTTTPCPHPPCPSSELLSSHTSPVDGYCVHDTYPFLI